MNGRPTGRVRKELKRCIRLARMNKGKDFWDTRIQFKEKLTFEEFVDLNSRLTGLFPPPPKKFIPAEEENFLI